MTRRYQPSFPTIIAYCSPIFILLIFKLQNVSAQDSALAYQWQNTYQKPKPSNAPCIDIIERMEETIPSLVQSQNSTSAVPSSPSSLSYCLSCHMVQETCPISALDNSNEDDDYEVMGCQEYIDAMYTLCNGVTLPMYYYYDSPKNSITGTFNDEDVQRRLKKSAARCGCNGSLALKTRTSLLVVMVVSSIWYII